MNRRQRLATLVILQGFIQWEIQQGIIRHQDEQALLSRYMKQITLSERKEEP